MSEKFNVGDKVVINGTITIGTVIKITPKRKDVVVDYGRFKSTYGLDGYEKGTDIWHSSKIILLTPEIEKQIADYKTITKCKDMFQRTKLTADQAVRIIDILSEEEKI